MRSLFLASGLVLGAFGVLILQQLGIGPPALRRGLRGERVSAPVPTAAEATPVDPAQVLKERAALEAALGDPKGRSLAPLAAHLEEAQFRRSWEKVEAAASLVRERGASWVAPPSVPPPPPPSEREPPSLAELRLELQQREEESRRETLRDRAAALQRSSDPRKLERLLEIVREPDGREAASTFERQDAATYIARSADERAVGELLRLLASETEPLARHAAGIALAEEGYPGALRELVRLLETHASKDVRKDAAEALSRFPAARAPEGGIEIIAALVRAARKDAEPEVRAAVFGGVRQRMPLFASLAMQDATFQALQEDDATRVRAAALDLVQRHAADGRLPARHVRLLERTLEALENGPKGAPFVTPILDLLSQHGDAETLLALDRFAATGMGQSLGDGGDVIGSARRRLERALAREREAAGPR